MCDRPDQLRFRVTLRRAAPLARPRTAAALRAFAACNQLGSREATITRVRLLPHPEVTVMFSIDGESRGDALALADTYADELLTVLRQLDAERHRARYRWMDENDVIAEVGLRGFTIAELCTVDPVS